MAVSVAQAKRIEANRKTLEKEKEEFLLSPIEPSRRQEVIHRNALLSAVDETKKVVMEQYISAGSLEVARRGIEESFNKMPWWDDLESQATELVGNMDEWHAGKFYETTSTAAGINVAGFVNEAGIADLLESMVQVNVDQIGNLKESTRKRAVDLINNSLTGQESKSATLEKQLREIFTGSTANNAKFIARDQTQRAVNGLNRFRQEKAGIRKYKWVTSKDSRVRPNHKQMNGLEVEWSSGIILTTDLSKKRGLAGKNVKNVANGHIGQDFQCRCTASPILEI